MSSTIRVYVNDKRVATAKPWGTAFLQVYPEQKTYASEAEWRSAIFHMVLNGIRFETDTPSSTPAPPPTPASSPTPVRPKPSLDPKDWVHSKLHKATLPAGKYYIGDLCYALHDTLYDKVFGPRYRDGLYTSLANPNDVFMVGNTGGDDLYKGTDGKGYPVDSGIIGIASIDTVDSKKFPYHGGSLYTFTSPVTVKLKEDKFIFYGEKYNDPRLTIYIQEEDYEDSE